MRGVFWMLPLLISCTWSENLQVLQYTGVRVKLDQNRTLMIERHEPPACMDIAITPENLSDKQIMKIPAACRYTVLKTVGIVQPMQLDPKIRTFGELEVLSFIKKVQAQPQRYILLDSRTEPWYRQSTIPSAVNIPYNEMQKDPDFPEEHVRLMKLLRIKKKKEGYDFSAAKNVLLFCNGAWCVQSPQAIKVLVEMGYPKEKIFWYRGGMQVWLSMGFTAMKPSENP